MTEKIAVIIPAYNEEKVIRDCLNALATQNFSDYVVHLIDDASTDSTKSIIQTYVEKFPKKIVLHDFGKVGPGRARNRVAEMVGAPIVAFTDADCAPDREWLKYIAEGFSQKPDAASIGGPQFAMLSSSPFQKKVEKFFRLTSGFTDFYKKEKDGTEIKLTSHNPLCNVAYRKDIFLKMNGFRADFFPGEDIELDVRMKKAGHPIYFHPKAKVFHHRPETIEQFRKVMFSYGLAQGRLIREHGITRKIQWLGLLIGTALLLTPILFALIFDSFLGFLIGLALVMAILFWRPKSESLFSLGMNAFHWLNGFVVGLAGKSFKKKLPFF